MSRKKAESLPKPSSPQSESEPVNNLRNIRETVEALVIALVLAFFFKAFAAEAFVIPTGSMATTLMGRHKDVLCDRCGFPFQISASEESNDGADRPRDAQNLPTVLGGTCPQCRWTMYVGKDNFEKKTYLSFNGDRIFVNKSQFDFRNPKRWHVTVFRYPGKAQMNYIKRLVGVENETVRIQHGDIFVQKDGESEFTIQRKPLRALLAMLRPVDDNDYVIADLHGIGWPTRWYGAEKQWEVSDDFKTYRIDGTDRDVPAWLHYRHVVPSSNDWYYLSQNELPPHGIVDNPQLITDFIGYNSGVVRIPDRFGSYDSGPSIAIREVQRDDRFHKEHFCTKTPSGMGLNWVGDLAISCRLTVEKPNGIFWLRLVKGGIEFLCGIELETGTASFSIPARPDFQPPAVATPIRTGHSFDVLFCNVDEELRLIVDGREIDFNGEGCYDRFCRADGPMPRDRSPNRLDLTPAGFASQGASVAIGSLKIQRDMYYLAIDNPTSSSCDLADSPFRNEYLLTENTVNRVLSTPELWKGFGKTNAVTISLGKDQFLMLGDNSAKSKDSRLWTQDGIPHHVDRELLIGEAVFVYWPHGLRIPGTRVALIPNLARMRFID